MTIRPRGRSLRGRAVLRTSYTKTTGWPLEAVPSVPNGVVPVVIPVDVVVVVVVVVVGKVEVVVGVINPVGEIVNVEPGAGAVWKTGCENSLGVVAGVEVVTVRPPLVRVVLGVWTLAAPVGREVMLLLAPPAIVPPAEPGNTSTMAW